MTSRQTWSRVVRGVAAAGICVAVASAPLLARADVRLEGDWGSADPSITLDISATPRARAIELLADAAGFSVVMSSPLPDLVDIHVKDQPASKVLALLLPHGTFVVRRSANLVSIEPSDASGAAVVPVTRAAVPGSPARQAERGEDRTVLGGKLTLEKGEVAHDVAVFGGNLDVYGTVTGDLAVLGGAAHVHDGAKVLGSATVLGGHMRVDDGAEVDHDVSVVGGHLDRGAHAKVHEANADDDEKLEASGQDAKAAHGVWASVKRWGDDALSSLSLSALLFVFGAVVLALATDRSRALQVEVAARPMRTLALGVVGAIAAIALSIALCVTLIGIPVALVGVVVFILAAYAGVCAVLTTAGEALVRHRTTNAYVHLAVGCGLYFLVGLVPWFGAWAAVGVFLAGVGVMVATRGAGLVPVRTAR